MSLARRVLLLACLAALGAVWSGRGGVAVAHAPPAAPALVSPRQPPAPLVAPTASSAQAVETPDAGPPNGCPDGMARVGAWCIDRYEAHLVARGPGGALTAHPYFARPRDGVVYEARSDAGVFPQAYVSRIESQAACAYAGKRLCSMTEWRRACEGAAGTNYPYGARWQPRQCNTDKPHLLTLRFGEDPLHWRYEDFNDPILSREPGFLARSGEHEACVGDAGVYDLVGNVHEWVSDTVSTRFMERLAADGVSRSFQPWQPGNGVFMGGFYSTREEHGPGCKFTTVAHEPGYHDYSTGFRCCADASP